jgi:hypothetical protein
VRRSTGLFPPKLNFQKTLAAGACAASFSCGEVTGLPHSRPLPLVQVLLVAGSPVQTAAVQYSSPAGSVVPHVTRPVAVDSVSLNLITPGGAHIPFAPVSGLPTRFEAQHLVLPGEVYVLAGTVAGATIQEEVTVPGPLTIREPAEDTLRLSLNSGLFRIPIPFSWYAPGSASYAVRQLRDGGEISLLLLVTADTTGILELFPFFDATPDTTHLIVWAYEQAAAAFFLDRSGVPAVRGSGAIIGFGAAVASSETTVIWQ